MKQHKNAIIIVSILAILIIVLWKCVYPKKADKESGYLYLDGSWYLKEPWQDSWPNH